MPNCDPIRLPPDDQGNIPWTCAVCGFHDTVAAWPPQRRCSQMHFTVEPTPGPRGLGDTVARVLGKLGIGKRSGCGCDKRQEWLNRVWPYRRPAPFTVEEPEVLFVFQHGLGDAVQFTVVLRHIQQHLPHWTVDVLTEPGKGGIFRGLCRDVFETEPPPRHYDLVKHVEWWEPMECWADSPSTKSEKFIRQILGRTPDPSLGRYAIQPSEADYAWADDYLTTVAARSASGRFPVVGLHYQGSSSAKNKNLDETTARLVVRRARERGLVPLLFDWDHKSTLHDPELRVFRDTQQASTIAAVIDRLTAFVGIDSGPGHIAGATSTPTLIVWRHHHPLHYYGLSPNVTHLVRGDHAQYLRGDAEAGQRFFARHYQYISCEQAMRREVDDALRLLLDGDLAEKAGAGYAYHGGLWVRRPQEPDNMIVRDVVHQDCYGLRTRDQPHRVLDIGAHIGSFAHAVHRRWPTAQIACVEPDPANLEALEVNTRGYATVIRAALFDQPTAYLHSSVGSENSGGSYVSDRGVVSVTGLTLTEILDQLGWAEIDILKMDCEGGELYALADPAIARCRLVVGEVHDEPAFRAAVAGLGGQFQVQITPHPHNPGGLKLFEMRRLEIPQPQNDFQPPAKI